MGGFFKSRLFFVSLAIVIIASTLPLYVSGYVLGLLTVAGLVPPILNTLARSAAKQGAGFGWPWKTKNV